MKNDKLGALREEYSKKSEDEFFKEIYDKLEMYNLLNEQGKHEAATDFVESCKEELRQKLAQEKTGDLGVSENDVDRAALPEHGNVFADNDRISLKVIQYDEKDYYISVSYEYSFKKSCYNDPLIVDEIWNDFNKEYVFTCSIYDKETSAFVGYCSIKDMREDDWEIAIELMPEYCHQGYGYEALSMFVDALYSLFQKRFFRIRVDLDNYASQALMRKLGAYPNGISEFGIKGENLIDFQQKHRHIIDSKIQAVADEFCMDAEDILGYVLEYRLDMVSGMEV